MYLMALGAFSLPGVSPPPVTRGNATSDRQWSKKHPFDQ